MTILYTLFERERERERFLISLLIIYIDGKKVGKI